MKNGSIRELLESTQGKHIRLGNITEDDFSTPIENNKQELILFLPPKAFELYGIKESKSKKRK